MKSSLRTQIRRAMRLVAALCTLALTANAVGYRGRSAFAAPDRQTDTLVVVPGTIQSKLGCDADWKPDCTKTALTLDPASGIYRATFDLPAGTYEYKVALNGSWTVNYGAKAKKDGANITLNLAEPRAVTFLYDPATNYITDTVNTPLTVVTGDVQIALGCAADNDAKCLKTWMQDIDGDGVYTFTTTALPKGDYKVAVSFDENAAKTSGEPIAFAVAADKDEIYFEYNSAKQTFKVFPGGAPRGDLSTALAVFATNDTILWKLKDNAAGNTYTLYYAPEGGIALTAQGVTGGQQVPLTLLTLGINLNQIRAPHLKGYDSLRIAAADRAKVPDMLRGQLVVAATSPNGKLIDASSVQLWGALDSIYDYTGPLGVTFASGVPTLRVWSPTAKSVTLHLYDDSKTAADSAIPMTYDAMTGVWSALGEAGWKGKFYLYEVQVYVRATGKIERNFVTDPYSLSLAMNSTRSQIVDLDDPALMPDGWTATKKPPLAAPEDIVIYELHVRDFSVFDQTVPDAYRGTYMAFTVPQSNGMKHLTALAQAGLTHLHLLPTADIATVEEDKTKWEMPDYAALAKLPPDSDQQQAEVTKFSAKDGFNWGYDPYHYTTPEGSYATQPDGSARIKEYRAMVQALNAAGLRVVMDVVYNHTHASGQAPDSVLDRIVPGYYQRLNAEGFVENSTCCANTASEHKMMEKLMVDSMRTWATAYKIDAFRFDLMGHHMTYNIDAVRTMLDGLTVEKDGVDGKAIYLYGEGWDFGEVAMNARGLNATQLNMAGTGVGTFNDRLRDGVRGGTPFSDQRDQGFVSGLFGSPSAYQAKALNPAGQKAALLANADLIRIGLAGNLADYRLVNAAGKQVRGLEINYGGAQAGYTADPQENIVYASAHDNQTIFDAIQLKAPESADIAARVRMNNLANDIVMFSQGVPFFHAGDDMLRSKSLDRDSYNSGDWFNILDFSYTTNGWGRGLPVADKNKDNWAFMKPLLANPALKPTKADIEFAAQHFREILQIRKSMPLFGLQTAKTVQERLTFFNVGPDQLPGVIGMRITGNEGPYKQVVVIFNATDAAQQVTAKDVSGAALILHPVLANGGDPVVKTATFDVASGTFTVPARTTVVFVDAMK